MQNNNFKGNVVLLYYPSMRTSLLFRNVLKLSPLLFNCVIMMPAIPYSRRTNKRNFKRILKVLIECPQFFFMSFFTVKVFSWVSSFFQTSIRDICLANNIEHLSFDRIDNDLIDLMNSKKPDWILSASSALLTERLIKTSRCGVLNFHEAPLPHYRGSASYFWFLVNNEKSAHTTIHYVVEELDAGDIVFEGPIISLEKINSVFLIWKNMILSYDSSWPFLMPYLIEGLKIPSSSQKKLNIKPYSYPTRDGMKKLKKKKVGFFKFNDITYIIRYAIKGYL